MTRRAIQWIGTAASAERARTTPAASACDRRHARCGGREASRRPSAASVLASHGISRDDAQPQLRIEDARRSGAKVSRANSSRRFAPIRVALSSTSSSMRARGAQVGVERVVLLLLARRARRPRRRSPARAPSHCPWSSASVRRGACAEAASRGVRSAIAACRATPSGSFSRPQAQKVGVGEVRLLQRGLDGGQRRAGRLEVERALVVRGRGRGRARARARERPSAGMRKAG